MLEAQRKPAAGEAAGGEAASEDASQEVEQRMNLARKRRAKGRKEENKEAAEKEKQQEEEKEKKDKEDPDALMDPNFEAQQMGPEGEEGKEGAEGKDAEGAAEEEEKEADEEKGPKAGDKGILTEEITTKLGDKDTKLESGTVVEIISKEGEKLKVKVHSGHKGAETIIDGKQFKPQPGVAMESDGKTERDDVYQEYQGKLWGDDGPVPDDVAQGFIGDCYLVAAMMAVVAREPGAIKRLFKPHTPNQQMYTITIYSRNDLGKLVPKDYNVDNMLPSLKGKDHEPAYANNGKGKDAALWPALLEKAYAIASKVDDYGQDKKDNTYAAIGDGGYSGEAMERITGEESQDEKMPEKEDVVETFKKFEKEGKAVTCSSLGEMEHTKQKAFTEKDGTFTGTMTTHEGKSCEIVPGTLKVEDKKSKKPSSCSDDSNGKMNGDALEKGTVDYYETQKVELTYKKDQKPDTPDNLEATYDFRGDLSEELRVYAHHAYVFEKVEGETIVLKNPWGTLHPKRALTAQEFTKFFRGISSNEVPEPPAEKK